MRKLCDNDDVVEFGTETAVADGVLTFADRDFGRMCGVFWNFDET